MGKYMVIRLTKTASLIYLICMCGSLNSLNFRINIEVYLKSVLPFGLIKRGS